MVEKRVRLFSVLVVLIAAGTLGLGSGVGWAAEEKETEVKQEPTQESPPAEPMPSEKLIRVADTVITGTWTPHAQKDSPVEIERITSKMLEQAGATNVRQVLQDVPAIESRRAPGGFQTFQIQGLSAIHTLFLINGQELIGTAEGATVSADLLASPEIESIEIVKGAAAVQYGSDAIAGVINIRTRKATKPAGALLFGQYGKFNTVTTFAAPEFRSADGKFGGYIAAGISKSDGFDLNTLTAQTDGDTQFSTKNVSGYLDYKLSNHVTLSWYSRFADNERRGKSNSVGAGAAATGNREIQGDTERTQNILRMDWQPDALSTFTLWGHHQVFQSKSQTFRLSDNVRTAGTNFNQQLWEPQFQYTRQIGSQQLLTFGGEHDIRTFRGERQRGGKGELTESAGWIQDEISVLPWMDILLGGRYTSNTDAGGFFSPQTTLLLKPGNFRGRFNYTRGFRSPDLGELNAFFVEPGGFGVVGNPNLQPEKSTSYTANVEYYFERAKLGASAFRHDVSNLIQAVAGTCTAGDATALGLPAANCAARSNVASVRSQGFEVEAGAKPWEWLYMETGYMYLDSRDQNTGSFLFTRSPHAWKTRVRVEYDGWDLTTRVRYFSSFGFSDLNRNGRIEPNEKAPSNVQMDVRLARTLTNGVELYGGVENLTQSRINVRSGSVPLEGPRLWFVGMRMTL